MSKSSIFANVCFFSLSIFFSTAALAAGAGGGLVRANAPCGGTLHNGQEQRIRHEKPTVDFNQNCTSELQTRTCDNGRFGPWNGTYTHTNCTDEAPPVNNSGLTTGDYVVVEAGAGARDTYYIHFFSCQEPDLLLGQVQCDTLDIFTTTDQGLQGEYFNTQNVVLNRDVYFYKNFSEANACAATGSCSTAVATTPVIGVANPGGNYLVLEEEVTTPVITEVTEVSAVLGASDWDGVVTTFEGKDILGGILTPRLNYSQRAPLDFALNNISPGGTVRVRVTFNTPLVSNESNLDFLSISFNGTESGDVIALPNSSIGSQVIGNLRVGLVDAGFYGTASTGTLHGMWINLANKQGLPITQGQELHELTIEMKVPASFIGGEPVSNDQSVTLGSLDLLAGREVPSPFGSANP